MAVITSKEQVVERGVSYVEHIQSTGTQWIDTGVVPNQDTRVVVEVINYQQDGVFGSRSSSYSNTFGLTSSGGYYRTDYGTEITNITAVPVEGRFTVDKNKNVTNFGGTVITQTYRTFSCPRNLYLFAVNNNGAAYDFGKVGICAAKIYDNGTLVRDLRPCYDPDGVACMYDRVSGEYLYNAGTGDFIAGKGGA